MYELIYFILYLMTIRITDIDALRGPIDISRSVKRKTLKVEARPFSIFTMLNVSKEFLLNTALSIEANIFLSAGANFSRELFSAHPLYKDLSAWRNRVEGNAIESSGRFSQGKQVQTIRERGQLQVPIAFLLYIACTLIAFDDAARMQLEFAFQPGSTYLPTFLIQMLTKVRWSICGQMRIVPELGGAWQGVITMFGFKDTLLDVNFLRTAGGMRAFLSLLEEIRSAEGCYIPFTQVSSLPTRDSGDTTTFCAIGVDNNHSFIEGMMYMLPGHSFGVTVKAVHFIDAAILQLTHSGFTLSYETFTSFEMASTLRDQCSFMIRRVTGIIVNDSGLEDNSETTTSESLSSREQHSAPFEALPSPIDIKAAKDLFSWSKHLETLSEQDEGKKQNKKVGRKGRRNKRRSTTDNSLDTSSNSFKILSSLMSCFSYILKDLCVNRNSYLAAT